MIQSGTDGQTLSNLVLVEELLDLLSSRVAEKRKAIRSSNSSKCTIRESDGKSNSERERFDGYAV